ncbi:MAG TPA: shikimate kinase [Candidatus Kapabacteria bacterium]|jgi:shikimate kinase|nr:shikimate kinase [Candidatus Kapabacteria bacterium]HPU24122.1 shikimate kinase [Candidatus Kapabacteria bacterium]
MKKFAVIGNPVINSASPIIYNHLFKINNLDAYYTRLLVTDIKNGLETFRMLNLDAVNVTMPYKQLVYGWVDYPDEISKITETCNTLIFKEQIFGFNTDYKATYDSLHKIEVDKLSDILVIGAGSTAITVVDILSKLNKQIDIINRTKENVNIICSFYSNVRLIDEETIKKSYDLIINTASDLRFFKPYSKLTTAKFLFDFNYMKNQLCKLFHKYQKLIDGFEILKNQAFYAFKHFADDIFISENVVFDDDKISELLRQKKIKKDNISLIGMTSVGKTEFARSLARELNMDYFSVDEFIEKQTGKSVSRIFEEHGEQEFRKIEAQVIKQISMLKNTIIDTGGGSCIFDENIEMLKSCSFVVFLARKPEHIWNDIKTDNRPILKHADYEEFLSIFNRRLDNYFKCSDLIYSFAKFDTAFQVLKNELSNYLNAD